MDDNKAPLQSEEEEVTTSDEQAVENEGEEERMIPKSRLDSVIKQREEFKIQLEESNKKLSTLEQTVNELQKSVKEERAETGKAVFTNEEVQALDKIDMGLRERGYITKKEQEEMVKIQQRSQELTRLQDKYKKGSGYPEFRSDEIMAYAESHGFGDNLEAAYRDKHFDAFIQAELKRSKDGGVQPPDSEKPVGGARDTATQVTRQAIAEMTPAEYERNREAILGKFRKSATGR